MCSAGFFCASRWRSRRRTPLLIHPSTPLNPITPSRYKTSPPSPVCCDAIATPTFSLSQQCVGVLAAAPPPHPPINPTNPIKPTKPIKPTNPHYPQQIQDFPPGPVCCDAIATPTFSLSQQCARPSTPSYSPPSRAITSPYIFSITTCWLLVVIAITEYNVCVL